MKILGSVRPEDVPRGVGTNRSGTWTTLARQVIEAHEQGQVLEVTVADRAEYKRLVNGMAEVLREAGYSRIFTAIDEPDGSVHAYLQLRDKLGKTTSVVVQPIRRPRKRTSA